MGKTHEECLATFCGLVLLPPWGLEETRIGGRCLPAGLALTVGLRGHGCRLRWRCYLFYVVKVVLVWEHQT